MASRTSGSSVPAARNDAAWGSLLAGVASVGAMPLAVNLTGLTSAYQLKDVWMGIPVAALLGFLAISLARRARRRNAVLLSGGTGVGLARAGRVLGVVGVCMALATLVAFGVLGLLDYVGSHN